MHGIIESMSAGRLARPPRGTMMADGRRATPPVRITNQREVDAMNPDDPPLRSPSTPAGDGAEATPAPPPRDGSKRIWPAAILAGAVAGSLAWLVGEAGFVRVEPAVEQVNLMGQVVQTSTAASAAAAERATAVRTYGVLGAALGLAMGLAGGIARGSLRAARAGLTGMIAGGLAGALLPLAALPLDLALSRADGDDMIPSLLMHLLMWVPLGAVGGLSLGLAAGGWPGAGLAAVGGAMGALIGTVAFELIGAVAFPLAETGRAISTTPGSRLLGRMLVAVLSAAGAAYAILGRAGGPGGRRTVGGGPSRAIEPGR
jgi:hypothetical protein